MNLRTVSAALLLLGTWGATPAQAGGLPPASASTGNAAAAQRDPKEVICERQDDTGSRVAAHKVCKTRAEWEAQRVETQRQLQQEVVSKGTQTGLGPG